MRYLGPAALTAASLVLLLATDQDAIGMLAAGPSAAPARAESRAESRAGAQAAAPAGSRAEPAAGAQQLLAPELAAQRLPAVAHQAVAHQAVALTAAALTAAVPAEAPPVRLRRTLLADPLRSRRSPLPAEVFTGAGFDACTAPPLETLRAWWGTSPYGAVGIYSSGRQRACAQPRLTAAWVREARAMGWRLIPTHVGRQAPCMAAGGKSQRIDPAKAVQQGKEEAAEAVRAVKDLGLRTGTPVYLDIEAYPRGDSACSQAVTDFTVGWTQALHKAGFRSGFYSSTDAGVADLAAAARAGSGPLPDAVWYARWDDRATTTDGAGRLGDDLWVDHARIHQHHGNVQETYGGAALTIDRDQLDGPVAR
ncbi:MULTISPECIES: DUF1906 domain-containing protein [Kitasatospora]|uniref:Rv2525c-like glycoside hydrolase-like domain-containing protein n=1 Tax=Kitasatospora setae (strain ATCC 33774 / DSM 43861 / JCM 3304 / KCC A-0304 / NBRC 14216 / KM-6054) TaxID=452652 RepID=E4NEB9_KITSK|nr:DUF1906 domain-containing protein [Kitasatospora setae]BAJ29550.1 hypothetical protein KSE_37510 [Kitasatospora setae KM-6054]